VIPVDSDSVDGTPAGRVLCEHRGNPGKVAFGPIPTAKIAKKTPRTPANARHECTLPKPSPLLRVRLCDLRGLCGAIGLTTGFLPGD
jgi:hypothetical protein